MLDGNNRLLFGLLLDPVLEPANHVVELATLSESLDYDLVMMRDDPDRGDRLDAWTTLSWIAARTERIRLGVSLTRLHHRLPTVIGRQIASLDLLSNGRAELALGPAESLNDIEIFGEAIDIVRAIVEAGEPGTVASNGPHFPLMGAARGPLPLHSIPIWIQGTALPLLELAGRTADGWIGSATELSRSNAVLVAAANAAGRDPRELARFVVVQGNEDLRSLVMNERVDCLLLDANDPATIEHFAIDTIPTLRATMADAKIERTTIKSTRIRAKRKKGIDYETIPMSLRTHAVEPGDTNYARLRSNYLRGGNPGLVLQPGSPAEVVEAIAYAKRHRSLPLSVRSRGHGISGRSTNDGGLIIDLRRMNRIEVLNEATRLVRIEPGARWMDVAQALQPHGWALSSGDYGGVGVGGLATAGGIGFLAREHGLTIDHIRAAQIVLADGSIVNTSATENPDLFWAIRGAGANFGIVTSFDFEVDALGNIGWAQLVTDATDTAGFLQKWGNWIESAPRDTTSFMLIGQQRGARQIYAHVMVMIDSDDPNTIVSRLQPLADVVPLLQQRVAITTYVDVISNASEHYHQGQGEPVVRSGLLNRITPAFAHSASELIHGGGTYFFQIRAMGGAVADVPPDATAFANRSANFSVVAFGANESRLNGYWDRMTPQFDGLYLNFETDTRPERLLEAFPEPTLSRLRELKRHYDPGNLFRDNFNVMGE